MAAPSRQGPGIKKLAKTRFRIYKRRAPGKEKPNRKIHPGEHNMIYKKLIILFFMAQIAVFCTACSKKSEINGIYVHQSGEQRYYTLTVASMEGNKHSAVLEGVPLERMRNTPWSLPCEQEIEDSTMKCGSFTLVFNQDLETATATYPDNERQVFVSDKKSITEDIRIYEKKQ